jgi:DNA-binding GntR family transcriptional regulator
MLPRWWVPATERARRGTKMRVGKDGQTLNSRVFDALRSEILNGKLLPGQRLKASSIAESYDVSLNVIREALNRLAGEKLVDVEPQFGFAVRGLSAEDLEDLVRQRVILEGIALRQCIQRNGVEWQSRVLAAHHRLIKTALTVGSKSRAINPEWLARHADFHQVILEACGSRRLFQIVRELSDAAEIYHRALLPVVSRDREMETEHTELLNAILAGDADKAVRVLTSHLEKTRNVMMTVLRQMTREEEAAHS